VPIWQCSAFTDKGISHGLPCGTPFVERRPFAPFTARDRYRRSLKPAVGFDGCQGLRVITLLHDYAQS
jgi:hypothetical protein